MTRLRFSHAITTAVLAVGCLAPAAQAQFDPGQETLNFARTAERGLYEHLLPDYRAELAQRSLLGHPEGLALMAGDSDRNFLGNLCWQHGDGCAGDIRFYDWGTDGFGEVKPLLWTARNGTTVSGHVWATKSGPIKRPGIVITNGSVQAPEELYWFAATTLAKAGYVVLTWDPQGQGRSDTYGAGADRNDGFPSQSGEPFYWGTEDALDFFFSTPSSPYVPRKSCGSGTSHAEMHARRVADGRNAAHNPFWDRLDTSRVGIAGHSLGASAVSYVGQLDPRVKAVVAWDNLRSGGTGGACAGIPGSRPEAPLVKPSLGFSNDYGLVVTPLTSAPDPLSKNTASVAFSKAGVDSAQINIRGGTHFEYSYIPNPGFPATLRGMDLAAWYTRAWFDKYVKGDPTADARLLTKRWHDDAPEKAVDPAGSGNLFSRYLRSRMDIGTAAGRFTCEDLEQAACAGLLDRGADRAGDEYSYLRTAQTKDADCADANTPVSRIAAKRSSITRRAIKVSGSATDAGCSRGLREVAVAVARIQGSRCQFVSARGRLAKRSSCRRPRFMRAKGTQSWRLQMRAGLPRGRYRLFARATDAEGNVERAGATLRLSRAR